MRFKNILFALMAVFLVLILAVSLFVGVDLIYHKKSLDKAGLNHRGYRGRVLGRKRSGEIRVVMLGGSSLFGYGVKHDQAIPALLEEKLNVQNSVQTKKKYSVVNLAYNNEGAYSFKYNLEDFDYLGYDYVVIYDGYNDMAAGNVVVYRHNDPIFRSFKYMPILPLILNEKLMIMKNGGNLEDAYRGKKIAFTLTAKEQIKVAALENSLKGYGTVENIIKRLKKGEKIDFDTSLLQADPWAWYTHYMRKAIDYALSRNKKVIIITQPYLGDSHRSQQKALREMLSKVYIDNSSVSYFDLGDIISVKNTAFCYDGMHLTAEGCKIMTDNIFEAVKKIIQ